MGQRVALFKNAPGVFSTPFIPEVRPLPGQRVALFKNAPGVFSTHLIPEVRPLPGQRSALFKNAPGVFVHSPRCFATGVCSHRFEFWCPLSQETLSDQNDLPTIRNSSLRLQFRPLSPSHRRSLSPRRSRGSRQRWVTVPTESPD